MSTETETEPAPKGDDAAPGGSGRTVKRLTARDKIEIIAMAKKSVPANKIAEMYGVHPSAIYYLLKKRGIKIGAYTAIAVEDAKTKARVEQIEKIKKAKDFAYRSVDFIQRQVMVELVNAQKAGEAISTRQDNIKTLKTAMETLRLGTDNVWKIFGLDRENDNLDQELPVLPIRELSERETEAIRDQQAMDDMEITGRALPEGLDEDDNEDVVEEGDDEGPSGDWGGGNDK